MNLQPTIRITERQSQILTLLVTRGSSNKQIAHTLGITESTVKIHVSNLLEKFGAKTRAQMIVFYPSMKTEVYKINQPKT